MNPGADLQPVPMGKSAWTVQADPDLLALPAPKRRERSVAVLLMLLTAVASVGMCWALRTEVAYAFARPVPIDVGDVRDFKPSSVVAGSYVEAHGMLGTQGAIRYSRPLEGDSFRLQPVASNPSLWVEIRVPEGMEGPRFIPPTTFAGRIVPMSGAGLRHAGLARSIRATSRGSAEAATDAWLLVDGASPRASRWAVALFTLFGMFAMWNLVNVARLLRPVRDD